MKHMFMYSIIFFLLCIGLLVTVYNNPIKVISLIEQRVSVRSFDGNDQLSDETINVLFNAASKAPSSFNNQPWRFLYARRGDFFWQMYCSFLDPFNQKWAQDASLLIIVLSKKTYNYKEKANPTYSFEAGLAVQNLITQAHAMGLGSCIIGGFDSHKIRTECAIPDSYEILVMIAVGYSKPSVFTEKNTARFPLGQMLFHGVLPK